MSIPDDLLEEYIALATDFSIGEKLNLNQRLKTDNPMLIKKLVAKNIITQYHSEKEAEQAEEFFNNQFQKRNDDNRVFEIIEIDSFNFENDKITLLDVCHQLKKDLSRNAIRRLIESGAVQINGEKKMDAFDDFELKTETKIKIGKRDFFELK